jgi:hypothetical protein
MPLISGPRLLRSHPPPTSPQASELLVLSLVLRRRQRIKAMSRTPFIQSPLRRERRLAPSRMQLQQAKASRTKLACILRHLVRAHWPWLLRLHLRMPCLGRVQQLQYTHLRLAITRLAPILWMFRNRLQRSRQSQSWRTRMPAVLASSYHLGHLYKVRLSLRHKSRRSLRPMP